MKLSDLIHNYVATSDVEGSYVLEYLRSDKLNGLAVPMRKDEPFCTCACGCGREVFYDNLYEIRMLIDEGRVHQFRGTSFASAECRERWWAEQDPQDLFQWVYLLRTEQNQFYAMPEWPRCPCCTRSLSFMDCERCNAHGYRIRILPNGHRVAIGCECLKSCGDVGPLEECRMCSGTGDDRTGPMLHSDDPNEPACDRNFALNIFTMHRPTREISVFALKFWGPREMNEWWRAPLTGREDTLAGLLARAIPQRDMEALQAAKNKREVRRLKRAVAKV